MEIKAKNSYESAKLLADSGEQYHCMAVQCAYYSGLQIAMALIMEHFGKNRDELDEWYERERATADPEKKPNSHVFYINKLYTAILNKTMSRGTASNFKQKLIDLKALRVDAAYNEKETPSDDVKDALNKARSLQENVSGYIATKKI